jgi:hypothetical protein
MKRLLLAIVLALPTISIANQAIDPTPDCIPCPPPPANPPDQLHAVELPQAN